MDAVEADRLDGLRERAAAVDLHDTVDAVPAVISRAAAARPGVAASLIVRHAPMSRARARHGRPAIPSRTDML